MIKVRKSIDGRWFAWCPVHGCIVFDLGHGMHSVALSVATLHADMWHAAKRAAA